MEDFYRPRYLYQLSAEGEAMERALSIFVKALQQPGELQALALHDIRDQLQELPDQQSLPGPDHSARERLLDYLVRFIGQMVSTSAEGGGAWAEDCLVYGKGRWCSMAVLRYGL